VVGRTTCFSAVVLASNAEVVLPGELVAGLNFMGNADVYRGLKGITRKYNIVVNDSKVKYGPSKSANAPAIITSLLLADL